MPTGGTVAETRPFAARTAEIRRHVSMDTPLRGAFRPATHVETRGKNGHGGVICACSVCSRVAPCRPLGTGGRRTYACGYAMCRFLGAET